MEYLLGMLATVIATLFGWLFIRGEEHKAIRRDRSKRRAHTAAMAAELAKKNKAADRKLNKRITAIDKETGERLEEGATEAEELAAAKRLEDDSWEP